MPIHRPPTPGSLVVCDFNGFKAPEMAKCRPVVVVAPTWGRQNLCTVVPLSTTPPGTLMPYHHEFSGNPIPGRAEPTWAKCDMVTTVSLARLDRIKLGRGRYEILQLNDGDFEAIKACLKLFFGI